MYSFAGIIEWPWIIIEGLRNNQTIRVRLLLKFEIGFQVTLIQFSLLPCI